MNQYEVLYTKTQSFDDELLKVVVPAHCSQHAKDSVLKQFEDARIYRVRAA